MRRLVIIIWLILAVGITAWPSEKKKKKDRREEVTQVLELPKEPPAAVVADTDRLVFQVSPLSSNGLLSQQLRDALKWVLRQDRAVTCLRVFVAGTGDTRRVQTIVSEMFSDKRLALPALSVLQVGGLPQDGAQVLVEAVLRDKRPVNPHGVAFLSSQSAYVPQPLQPVLPLVDKVSERLRTAIGAAGIAAGDVIHVGCYLTSLEEIDKARGLVATRFPQARLTFVQPLRGALQSGAACDAVARLSTPARGALEFLTPPEFDGPSHSPAVAMVGPGRVAFSSAQLAFGTGDNDARLAFERLGKSLQQVAASLDGTALARVYSLSRTVGELARKAGAGFFAPSRPPAETVMPFEGLPSIDASFAVDVIVLLPETK